MTSDEPFFDRWIASHPDADRPGFHRDGIVDESLYWTESKRIVFLLLEPNSKGGNYDRFHGADLRKVFRIPLKKEVNRNLALWTRYLLDGATAFERPDAEAARDQIRRVAIVNLKKIAGGGTADYISIARHAWRDRAFLREQIALLGPTLIVTCGEQANRIFGQVAHDDSDFVAPADRAWRWGAMSVLPGNHPSLRPIGAEKAFRRLIARHSGEAGLTSVTAATPSSPRRRSENRAPVRPRDTQGQAWILRPYPHRRLRLREFLEGDLIAIGWPGVGDLRGLDREGLMAKLRDSYVGQEESFAGWASTILRFRDDLREDDLVVVAPALRHSMNVAIARVAGAYTYRADLDGEAHAYPHTRPVRWLATAIPRAELPERVSRSITRGTLHRTDAEALTEYCVSL